VNEKPVLNRSVPTPDAAYGAAHADRAQQLPIGQSAPVRAQRGSLPRILLVGAGGFIGTALLARLTATGHFVRALARSDGPARRTYPRLDWVDRDIAALRRPSDWLPWLEDIDAVVNCAGLLQSPGGDALRAVHAEAIAALATACTEAGVRRFIHFSAVGVERGATPFALTKGEGDAILSRHDLDWVILRPSVVVGRAAAGGGALLRGIAGLPVAPRLREAGPLQIVQLRDVTDTVVFFLDRGAPSRLVIDLAGPDRMALGEVIAAYRRWLGLRPAPSPTLPDWIWRAAARIGDVLTQLGWRSAVNTTALRELRHGAVGNPARWVATTHIVPQSLAEALQAEPASTQDRWHARLYFLRPLVLAVFATFWIATGCVSLGPGWEVGLAVMQQTPAASLAVPAVIAGGLADLVIGLGMLWRRTARPVLWAALGLSIFYVVAGAILAPQLWIDPLGPMLKVWPILALNLVLLALLDDR
jgi:uncharacterized protein YbjT (DUF2867 family)